MMIAARSFIITGFLIFGWQLTIWLTGVPRFILPSPLSVADALYTDPKLYLHHAGITALEILLGLIIGTLIGACTALIMVSARSASKWLMPALVVSQAVPVFALAPILVLWLGYGLASKVAMAALIIFFPVTSSFLDGLRRTDPGWQDLAATMRASPSTILWRIRIPAALPAFSSGLRVAAAVAPIGAIVGEWVGSSGGLGYLMLHANGRMQTDVMFAALAVLAVMGLALFFGLDRLLRSLTAWQSETSPL